MINFEHSSITNPAYAPTGVSFLSLKSSNLQGRGEISIYLPAQGKSTTNLPFIILLHGVYGSHFSWLYQAGVHRVLDQMLKDKQLNPFMLVMPSDGLAGDGTGYLPHVVKDYEKWIIEDVFEAINYHFPEISTKSSAFITGLSMGGYGALHLGIKHHQLFDGISAHSAITDLSDFQSFIDEQHQTFISPKNIQEARIIDYAQKFKENIPPLRFDCGVEDRLIESNRKLHKQLEQDQIDHKYEEFSGSHNYEYWTTHISRSFSFFQEIINWHQ